MKKLTALAASIAAVAAAGGVGAANGPQRPSRGIWYLLLDKPRYTPPGPVVGAVWGVLELLLVATGYRLMTAEPARARARALAGWMTTLVGLAVYPAFFFGQRRLKASSLAAGAMLAAAAGTAVSARKADRPAMWMMLPVVFWLGGATILSIRLQQKNRFLSAD